YIESLWVFESPIGLPPTDGNSAAPNGCSKLTFAYGNSFVSIANGKTNTRPAQNLNFVGIRDNSILLQSSRRWIGCIGVEFRPHGAFPVFGIPMGETVNVLGDADMLLGQWARSAQEGLNGLKDAEPRVAFVQRQLLLLLRKNQSSPRLRRQQSGS